MAPLASRDTGDRLAAAVRLGMRARGPACADVARAVMHATSPRLRERLPAIAAVLARMMADEASPSAALTYHPADGSPPVVVRLSVEMREAA